MSLHLIRKAIAAAFLRFGYQISRKRTPGVGAEPFFDQAHLLGGTPVAVILDVGANTGDIVQRYRALFPAATIHAFEPFPAVHRQLAERFAADAQVRTHQCAVTDSPGPRRFFSNEVALTNSLLRLNPVTADWHVGPGQRFDRTVEVSAVTLDQFCAAEGLALIDVLKMDIQGGEAMALEGAAGLLARKAVRVIYLEVLFAPLYDGQGSFFDVAAILHRHGYELFGLYNLVQGEQGLAWADAIFRPSHPDVGTGSVATGA
jgi:FkbM family methyltransferase